MAFDGFFYYKHCLRLKQQYQGLKLDKIYQANKSDLYLSFNRAEKKQLLLSINSAAPRIEPLAKKPEMPERAPMFCMLLRKHLSSAQLEEIEQLGMERIINLKFKTTNQIGETIYLTLTVELMGKHSNIMLIKEDGTIIDALKRIGASLSPRIIAPSYQYQLPPASKINLLTAENNSIIQAFKQSELNLNKAIYNNFAGFSPAITNIILKKAKLDGNLQFSELKNEEQQRLVKALKTSLKELDNDHFYIYKNEFKIKEISAFPLGEKEQLTLIKSDDYQPYLNQYYIDIKNSNSLHQRAKSSVNHIENSIAKLKKKIKNLESDIKKAKKLEQYKLYGELLTANLYLLKKGDKSIDVINYYDNTTVKIALEPKKNGNENAQNYFKKYNKAKKTLIKAKALIAEYQSDIAYLQQVKAMLDQSDSNEDIDNLIAELAESGYIKAKRSKRKKKNEKLPPHHYQSSEGIDIYVGRNNLQNDQLTLKKAGKEHIWLHTKDIAGAHVIIAATFAEINDQTLTEAAEIAAYHSDGRMSAQVPVDLTEVKYVKKPKGAKPGMVIYTDNKTIYANPDREKIASRKVIK